MRDLVLEAMSLYLPDTPDHPNKLPFKGILTRIGLPSDGAPSGSGGKRIILSEVAARAALPTLLGMAIDFVPALDGHDPTRKIGLITKADIHGNALEIGGILYAADFPGIIDELHARRETLGFSFEASSVSVADEKSDPLVIKSCIFTGAAVLRKDRAAYRSTSFDAARAAEERSMPMISDISTQVSTHRSLQPAIKAGRIDCLRHVMPQVQAIRKVAANLSDKGIGLDPSFGHVAVLNAMADDLTSQAQQGAIPHRFKFTSAPDEPNNDPNVDLGEDDPDCIDDGDTQTVTAGLGRLPTSSIRRRTQMTSDGANRDQHIAAVNLQKTAERLGSSHRPSGPVRRTIAAGAQPVPSLLASINGPARPLSEWNEIQDGLPTDERIQIKVLLRQRNLIV